LSAALALRAREAAAVQDRSLTEQVEHWARLGQIVETTVLGSTVAKFKAIAYDAELPKMLAFADSAAGRRKAAKGIAARHPVRYGMVDGKIIKIDDTKKKRRKR
jgi:hypothetical protein